MDYLQVSIAGFKKFCWDLDVYAIALSSEDFQGFIRYLLSVKASRLEELS